MYLYSSIYTYDIYSIVYKYAKAKPIGPYKVVNFNCYKGMFIILDGLGNTSRRIPSSPRIR